MKVLVCGGRDFGMEKDSKGNQRPLRALWDERHLMHETLDRLRDEWGLDCLIEGGAPGADLFAGAWADRNEIDHIRSPAKWNKHGNKAGPIRNEHMLRTYLPDLVVAFPGGKGTANMTALAHDFGIETMFPERKEPSP